ncbi:hypothetical protein OEZ86_005070 [Tetradesmus obliquus]|nr:hypothetical protein OEZ86_005070 [Tetradesmus obliquus]
MTPTSSGSTACNGGRFFTTNNTGPACTACPGASTTNGTGSASCTSCKPGHAGPLPCTACPADTWSPGGPVAANINCTACPPGSSSPKRGSTSPDDCIAAFCVVKPLSECGAAVKDGCGGICELKCASASQCMFGTQTFVEIGVCVPTPEPTSCSGIGLPPPLELGAWDDACRNTPIGKSCIATCPDKYKPGSSGAPTSACSINAVKRLAWSKPVGSCEPNIPILIHINSDCL